MNRGKKRKIEDLHKELKLIQKILNNNMKTKKKLINKNEKIVSSFLKPKNIWNPIKEKGFVTIGVIPKDGKVLFFENNQVFLDYENLIKNMMKVSEIEHFNWKDRNVSGVFLASVIPNPKEIHSNEKEEVEEFTINEARELDLENIPLSLSHEDQIFTKVGYVNKQFEFGNQQKDLMVTGVFGTDTDSFYGITGLLRKQYKDVSLQHLMTKYVFSDNNYHITKKPIELSLCEEGRRYGSSVYLLFTDCFDSGIIERDQKIHIYACPSNLKKFNKRGKIKKKY